MTHDRYAVGRDVDVELDRVGSGGDRLGERFDCVFGSMSPIAAVADDGPEVEIEQRIHLAKDGCGGKRTERHAFLRRTAPFSVLFR